MRESFQYKESMDVARELCLDLQQNLPLVYNGRLQSILKVLNLGEEVSLVDEYAWLPCRLFNFLRYFRVHNINEDLGVTISN